MKTLKYTKLEQNKLTSEKMIFSLEFGKHSAAGEEKVRNEDSVGYFFPPEPEELKERGQIFMVADGHGDEEGDFASKLAIETMIKSYYDATWLGSIEDMLMVAFKKANSAIRDANSERDNENYFSCSLSAAVIHENLLYLAGIGSCAVFLFSSNKLERLNKVTPVSSNSSSPFSRIHESKSGEKLLPELGQQEDVEIAVHKRQIQIKDTVLICTGNVAQTIPEQDISLIISSSEPVQSCETIVNESVKVNPQQDASAILIRVKGIKRLAYEDKETELTTEEVETNESHERQIVIKGVRYRETWEDESLNGDDRESMDKFSLDRELHRRVYKRQTPVEKSGFPVHKLINFFIVLIILTLIGYAAITYIPGYLRDLKDPQRVQTITADSIREAESDESIAGEAVDSLETGSTDFIAEIPVDTLIESVASDSVISSTEEQPQFSVPVSYRVVIINGSRKQISLDSFIRDISSTSSTEQVSALISRYRIKTSKILWRKSSESAKLDNITGTIINYQNLFEKYFRTKVQAQPLDFTLVLGADFKMPSISDQYVKSGDASSDYYMEILNGSRVSGLARKLANQLHHQSFKENRLVIVDYRNADKLNYPNSFIKCESAKSDLARRMAGDFNLPDVIVSRQLYDIKVIIGTDIIAP
ncbi:hypothetical protein B6I21_07875 [candidate division KSB1 bacterium 4572_119]|nr:MAG: hypothetical protein B6I21_07875 [candidate division KSB1 bacterium 4572_119]